MVRASTPNSPSDTGRGQWPEVLNRSSSVIPSTSPATPTNGSFSSQTRRAAVSRQEPGSRFSG